MRVAVLSTLLASVLVGCITVTTGHNLQRESARAITPTPYPDSVRISDVQGNIRAAKWVATTPGGVYDCSLEDKERQPLCVKRETPR